ncbi:MAG TPA: AAA family ATPase, partial [Acetobacteraceae bacterium]|nr:AAA family ATPase [Acetobacteraceae bacterium]
MDDQLDPEAVLGPLTGPVERFLPPPPPRGKIYGRLRVLTARDAEAAPPRSYLLQGLIAPGELSLWFGPPKCGKSFLLLRLAYGLSRGQGMWGRVVDRAYRVLYVAAEGEGGFAARLLGLRHELGDAGDKFRYIAQRVVVGPPSGDLEDVIRAAKDMNAELIIIDTLARTFGEGDENLARDMNAFVTSVDQVREATGAHVAVIHHATKDGSSGWASARGSSALVAAADLVVRVKKGEAGSAHDAVVEAAKDDVEGAVLRFRLRSLEVAPGPDGAARWTCIAEEAEWEGPAKKSMSPVAREAMTYLGDLLCTEGQPLPTTSGFPPATLGLKGVREVRWREECDTRRLSMAAAKADRERIFR